MDLFNDLYDGTENLLPYDGKVNYYGQIYSDQEAAELATQLWETIGWQHDQALIFGKLITTKRQYAWFGDLPFQYTYSKLTKEAQPWIPLLLEIKHKVEKLTKEQFNSCLLNLYHSGEEGMTWHSDAEKELKKNGAIASLSFGAERKFSFKHKTTGEIISLNLPSGSLLVMKDETQKHWLHQLPKTKKVKDYRINLTFRSIQIP